MFYSHKFKQNIFGYLIFVVLLVFSCQTKAQSTCQKVDLFKAGQELLDSVSKIFNGPNHSEIDGDVCIIKWVQKHAVGLACCQKIDAKFGIDENFKKLQGNFCDHLKNGKSVDVSAKKVENTAIKLMENVDFKQIVQENIQEVQKNTFLDKKNKKKIVKLMEHFVYGINIFVEALKVKNLLPFTDANKKNNPQKRVVEAQHRRRKRMGIKGKGGGGGVGNTDARGRGGTTGIEGGARGRGGTTGIEGGARGRGGTIEAKKRGGKNDFEVGGGVGSMHIEGGGVGIMHIEGGGGGGGVESMHIEGGGGVGSMHIEKGGAGVESMHIEGGRVGSMHIGGGGLGCMHIEGGGVGSMHIEGGGLGCMHIEGGGVGSTEIVEEGVRSDFTEITDIERGGAGVENMHIEGGGIGSMHIEGGGVGRMHIEGGGLGCMHIEGGGVGSTEIVEGRSEGVGVRVGYIDIERGGGREGAGVRVEHVRLGHMDIEEGGGGEVRIMQIEQRGGRRREGVRIGGRGSEVENTQIGRVQSQKMACLRVVLFATFFLGLAIYQGMVLFKDHQTIHVMGVVVGAIGFLFYVFFFFWNCI